MEFVRLGVQDSLSSLLDSKDLSCASAAAHAIRNLSSFTATSFCTQALVDKLTTRLQLGEHLTPQSFLIMNFMSHAAGALWNISREDRSTIMLMNSSTVKHALGSLPYVQEYVEARKRHMLDVYGISLSELMGDAELMQVVGGLDCGYSEHIFGIVSNVASFAEIRKGLVSFPLINNILAKILREGSNLAKCNAALAIKGMALDAGFRADALAYGMAKHLIAMLNGSDHQGQVKACGALSSLALGTSLTSSSFDTGSLSISSLVQLLDASDPEAAENASMALWTLSRNLKLRETIHRAGALEPLMKILSAKTDDEGALQRVRKCSIELLWNIMLNVARDNNSKHSERMEGLSNSLASDASSLPPSDNP